MSNQSVNVCNRVFDYDVLFLGGLFPQFLIQEIIQNSKSGIQTAANNLQWAYVQGIDDNNCVSVRLINSLFIGAFPFSYKKVKIETNRFSHVEGADDINVGFVNLPVIKHLSRYNKIKPFIKEWATSDCQKPKVMIAYAATYVMVQGLLYAKSLNASITTCLIIPDLPEHMHPGHDRNIYLMLKSLTYPKLYRDTRKIDSLVYLTQRMQEVVKTCKPFIVIEGISGALRNADLKKYNDKIRTIMYSGGIEKSYGVIDLAKSFCRINDKCLELVICGSGSDETELVEIINRDSRIKFLGSLPHDKVLELQTKAHFLINPRPNKDEFTRYSFPSKIIEYLSSGTVVIAYMLEGMPQEYEDYIIQIKDEENAIELAIRKVIMMSPDELSNIAWRGKDFVDKEKNVYVQAKKMLTMIEGEIRKKV